MNNLIGLVAMGGKSSRMGIEKCWIKYHGISQCYYAYEMLSNYCEAVFLSCNKSQTQLIQPGFKFIEDGAELQFNGPIASLLSAWNSYPEASFLLLGCDYPLLTVSEIKSLVKNRSSEKMFTAFYNAKEQIYEPLIAIYEQRSHALIQQSFDLKSFGLQALLQEHEAKKVDCDAERLKSFDSFMDIKSHFPNLINTNE